VKTITPGDIATGTVMAVPGESREKIITQITLQRLATLPEIAAAVAFLSPDHAVFITGANLPVNGGQFMG
jgi:acetoacetyl-CoA reductase